MEDSILYLRHMTPSTRLVFWDLEHNGYKTLKEHGIRLGLSVPTVSRAIDELYALGHISRVVKGRELEIYVL